MAAQAAAPAEAAQPGPAALRAGERRGRTETCNVLRARCDVLSRATCYVLPRATCYVLPRATCYVLRAATCHVLRAATCNVLGAMCDVLGDSCSAGLQPRV